MSDDSVAAALRSDGRLIVIEAPGGCGKTYQAAEYAGHAARTLSHQRVLVLAHTHAAVDTFAGRIKAKTQRVDIRTIDGFVVQIASAYHAALGLPPDPSHWARINKDGYEQLATKVIGLLRKSPMIARSLARRYPILICDEHQDASGDQHEIIMAHYKAGALLRVFGDPVQRIYDNSSKAERTVAKKRWQHLTSIAHKVEDLDFPHRWKDTRPELGDWICKARLSLKRGDMLDLRGLTTKGLKIILADNVSPAPGQFQFDNVVRKELSAVINRSNSLMILTRSNDAALGIRAYFNRSIPVWEGHRRDASQAYAHALQTNHGNPGIIADVIIKFVSDVAVGFTPAQFSNVLRREVSTNASKACAGKSAELQGIAKLILAEPNHRGAAKALLRLRELIKTDDSFGSIRIDYLREYGEAIRLLEFDDAESGVAEISKRRTFARIRPPDKCISTIHKAKGLECLDVIVMLCDNKMFSKTELSRFLLYVAMSRAQSSLTLVVSKSAKSPLLEI